MVRGEGAAVHHAGVSLAAVCGNVAWRRLRARSCVVVCKCRLEPASQADVREIVSADGRVTGLLLGSGEVLPAQAIIAGIGAQCVRLPVVLICQRVFDVCSTCVLA